MPRDKIAASIRRLYRLLRREERRFEREIKRALKEGHYERERRLSHMLHVRRYELLSEWKQWRLTQPPFVTKSKAGDWYERHPVTPENQHLLRPELSN